MTGSKCPGAGGQGAGDQGAGASGSRVLEAGGSRAGKLGLETGEG